MRLFLNTQRKVWIIGSAHCEAGRVCHCTCRSLNKAVFRQLLCRNDVTGVCKFDIFLLLRAYTSLWSLIQTRNKGQRNSFASYNSETIIFVFSATDVIRNSVLCTCSLNSYGPELSLPRDKTKSPTDFPFLAAEELTLLVSKPTVLKCIDLTLVNDQLDAQYLYFIIRLLQSSTCFEQRRAHYQEVKLY